MEAPGLQTQHLPPGTLDPTRSLQQITTLILASSVKPGSCLQTSSFPMESTWHAWPGTVSWAPGYTDPTASHQLLPGPCTERTSFPVLPTILTATHISKIEQFHRSTLRDIQGLPSRSSSAVTYLLLGALPFEASLHIQTLHLIGKIANDKDSLLHQIALRQLSVKDTSSQSWCIQCLRISSKYDLPSFHEVCDGSISPAKWCHLVNKTVRDYWQESLLHDAATKSTLQYVNITALSIRKAHPVWFYVAPNTKDVGRARIKSKLLIGTYMLQSNRSKLNKLDVDPTCMLCNSGPEDTEHFLPTVLSHIETPLRGLLTRDPVVLTQCILDSNFSGAEGFISEDQVYQWEFDTRIVCYYLHVNRTAQVSK